MDWEQGEQNAPLTAAPCLSAPTGRQQWLSPSNFVLFYFPPRSVFLTS